MCDFQWNRHIIGLVWVALVPTWRMERKIVPIVPNINPAWCPQRRLNKLQEVFAHIDSWQVKYLTVLQVVVTTLKTTPRWHWMKLLESLKKIVAATNAAIGQISDFIAAIQTWLSPIWVWNIAKNMISQAASPPVKMNLVELVLKLAFPFGLVVAIPPATQWKHHCLKKPLEEAWIPCTTPVTHHVINILNVTIQHQIQEFPIVIVMILEFVIHATSLEQWGQLVLHHKWHVEWISSWISTCRSTRSCNNKKRLNLRVVDDVKKWYCLKEKAERSLSLSLFHIYVHVYIYIYVYNHIYTCTDGLAGFETYVQPDTVV